ncbi:hypothetical protein ILUMI_11927 [Ignelater luminosus]|uniref:MD-2-related lipid-recognition domain-containing protein n=1 Tax=Ignelater luminosus TaxID=2038154 RepID=A0A8K0CZ77_IGNLU|nr:hypothetical protein ILUMI_11927 [Ignelater luminosus]
MKTRNFKFNRTHTAVNLTFSFNEDFRYDLKAQVQAYKFASNEYRLFPLAFEASVCDTLKNDDFGINSIYNCGNAPRCPLHKGNYTTCNWGPNYERFPPHWPVGRYRVDFTFMFMQKEISCLSWYMEVKSTKFLYFN